MPCLCEFPRFILVLFLVCFSAHPSFAETIELVTYYPASSNGGDLHVRSITVGTAYQSETPGDGTALIADRVGIGTSAPVGSLQVVGPPNQADTVLFMPGTGTGTIRVGVGTEAPQSILHVVGNGVDAENDLLLDSAGNDPESGPEIKTRRGRGTPAAPAAVQVGDDLGGVKFYGYNGTGYSLAGSIDSVVEQVPVAGRPIPASLRFFTDVPRMIITSAGNVGIGTETPQATSPANGINTGNLDVNDLFIRSTGRWASQIAPRVTSGELGANVSFSSASGKRVLLTITVTTSGRPVLVLGKAFIRTGTISIPYTDDLFLHRGATANFAASQEVDMSGHTFGKDAAGNGNAWHQGLSVMQVDALPAGTYTYFPAIRTDAPPAVPHRAEPGGTMLAVIEL